MRYSIAFSTIVSLALANTNLPFFWPGLSEGSAISNPDASIISANKSTVVAALNCSPSVDSNDCGWSSGQITLSIVSTSIYQASLGAVNFQCTSTSSKMACDMQLIDSGETTSVHTDLTGTDAAMLTATVTAGEDKLKAASTATAALSSASSGSAPSSSAPSSSGMVTSASAGAKPSGTGAASTGSAAKSSSGTPSSAAASPTPTPGAATRFGVEGAAFAAMVGAAALVL